MIESARHAAQQAVIDNLLADEDLDTVVGIRAGIGRLKAIALTEIGRSFVYADDAQLDAIRQSVHDLDATVDLLDRLYEEAMRVQQMGAGL